MVTDCPSQARWPGAARNFTAAIAASIIIEIVAKIAMPPPRGTTVSWYLSAAGCATNPARAASFLTMAVKMTDSANEPASKTVANMLNVSILTAPVIAF